MTTPRHSLNARLLRWALVLYPASYGAGVRAEVAEYAAHHIAHTGRLAGLREVLGVAGHGARTRFGLTSHHLLGRALAAVAPLAAVLAGCSALALLWQAARFAADPDFADFSVRGAEQNGPLLATVALVTAPTLMAAAALTGRWSAARVLAAATVVATPLIHTLARPELLGMSANAEASFGLRLSDLALLALNAALLLAAPPDRTHPRSAAPWAVGSAILAATAAVILVAPFGGDNTLSGFDLAPFAVGAAVACTARTPALAALATALLSVPPLLTLVLTGAAPAVQQLQRAAVLYAFGYLAALVLVRLTERPVRAA